MLLDIEVQTHAPHRQQKELFLFVLFFIFIIINHIKCYMLKKVYCKLVCGFKTLLENLVPVGFVRVSHIHWNCSSGDFIILWTLPSLV